MSFLRDLTDFDFYSEYFSFEIGGVLRSFRCVGCGRVFFLFPGTVALLSLSGPVLPVKVGHRVRIDCLVICGTIRRFFPTRIAAVFSEDDPLVLRFAMNPLFLLPVVSFCLAVFSWRGLFST